VTRTISWSTLDSLSWIRFEVGDQVSFLNHRSKSPPDPKTASASLIKAKYRMRTAIRVDESGGRVPRDPRDGEDQATRAHLQGVSAEIFKEQLEG
jgi:hypothetical protein